MGTFLIFLCGLIVVSGLMFLVASFVFGRGEELAPMPADATPTELPDDRPITGNDVRGLRLTVSVRGYRMADVDWVLDQMATQLDGRDAELALLRHRLAEWERAEAERTAAQPKLTVVGQEAAGEPAGDGDVPPSFGAGGEGPAPGEQPDPPAPPQDAQERPAPPLDGDDESGPHAGGPARPRLASNVVPAPAVGDRVETGPRRPRHLRDDE